MDGIENCFNSVTGYPATQPAMSADKWRFCWQLLIGFTIHTFGFTIDQVEVGTNINTFCVDDKKIYKISFMPKGCNNKTEWQWSESNKMGVKIHSNTRIGRTYDTELAVSQMIFSILTWRGMMVVVVVILNTRPRQTKMSLF